mmetsp:Transcript_5361/g.9746  ORF Transcript_5361/g.9746 Transcript_5361/m.9746 type:complete len:92 (-) Transcript_5361:837-1112(-)
MLAFSGEGVDFMGEEVGDKKSRDEENSEVLIVGDKVSVTARSPKDPLVGYGVVGGRTKAGLDPPVGLSFPPLGFLNAGTGDDVGGEVITSK